MFRLIKCREISFSVEANGDRKGRVLKKKKVLNVIFCCFLISSRYERNMEGINCQPLEELVMLYIFPGHFHHNLFFKYISQLFGFHFAVILLCN